MKEGHRSMAHNTEYIKFSAQNFGLLPMAMFKSNSEALLHFIFICYTDGFFLCLLSNISTENVFTLILYRLIMLSPKSGKEHLKKRKPQNIHKHILRLFRRVHFTWIRFGVVSWSEHNLMSKKKNKKKKKE